MKPKNMLQLSAVIFVVIALVHLWRALMGVPAVFGTWNVPVWLSWVAFVVAGGLAYASWTAR